MRVRLADYADKEIARLRYEDSPIPRNDELVVKDGSMYRVESVQYHLNYGRVDHVDVLCKYVANVGVGCH